MHVTHRLIALSLLVGPLTVAVSAHAQDEQPPPAIEWEGDRPPIAVPYEPARVEVDTDAPPVRAVEVEEGDDFYTGSILFIEANGAAGVQLGDTEYLPSGTPGDWQFPLVYGFGVGGTAGLMVADQVGLVLSYQYQRAQSRDGSLTGAIENVEGRIDYHTLVGGVRLYVPTGFGAFRGEVAVGVVFPHATVLQVDYGPALAGIPQPIVGSGFRTTNYSVGFGGQARIGYEIPIVGPLYAALDLQLSVYQAENSGEVTELENFVTDFEALPPVAVDATILHGDGAAQPMTRGVQSGLAVLSIGARF